MKSVAVLFFILASSFCSAKTCSEIESRTAAHDFYAKVQETNLFSMPTEEEQKKLKPYVTTSLYNLFSTAVLAEKKEFKRSQGKEPPLFEGHLFSGVTEGFTNFYISTGVQGKHSSEIYVLLQYAQHFMPYYANTPGIMEWKERVEVRSEGEKCLVNNIFYSLENNTESLAGVLASIVAP
jgi:hypothetical protein